MSEPTFGSVLTDAVEISDSDACVLIDKLSEARVKAAYWQGVAEERDRIIGLLGGLLDQYRRPEIEPMDWNPTEEGP